MSGQSPASAGHTAQAASFTKHKHFLATNKTSEKSRTFLTSIISAAVFVYPLRPPCPVFHLLHLDNIQKLSCFHQDEVTWELKT